MQPKFALAGPLLAFCLLLIGLPFFRRYTALPKSNAFFALLASCVAAGILVFTRVRQTRHFHSSSDEIVTSALAAGACILFLAAFVLRLWGRWIGDKATAAELLPGKPGVQAWFSAGNVTVALAIVVLAWMGFGISPVLSAVVLGAILASYPLLRTESTNIPNPTMSRPTDTHAPEREKILAMLEAGKLTPDESAELLQALGDGARSPVQQVPLTSGQRYMLIGAALVVLGFFLPWFSYNPGKELDRMMNQLEASVNQSMPEFVHGNTSGISIPNLGVRTDTVTMSGGDIGRGLGWAALLLAVVAAVLPYIGGSLDAGTIRIIRFLCLGIGGLIILYLVTQNFRIVGIGLVMALGGYALEIAGVLREKSPGVA
jgi:hypothetical protein